jgi:hypothetical protein
VANDFGIEAKVIGRVESFNKKKVTIRTANSIFDYETD